MTLQAAIIADDLTGALDTGTPFVEAGLKVAVAIEVEALREALARNPDVVVVNTASRALSAEASAARIEAVVAAIGSELPRLLFKKIDSRLKGNVAAESMAFARATGRDTIIVAPAIPDQHRLTINGAVTGRGVETPLQIWPLFPPSNFSVAVCDASSDTDLDHLVGRTDWSCVLAVGARGLGTAFARSLARSTRHAAFMPSARTLFAFGSRDPITAGQIERLCKRREIVSQVEAPAGELPDGAIVGLPAVARCSGEQIADPHLVVARFAESIRRVVERTGPEMLMMGGGDTAFAILRELGASVLIPNGEIDAGIPWFEIEDAHGRSLRCAVKSGGFGDHNSLLKLIPENLLSQTTSPGTRIEKQAW